jgi:hypothetical protein
MKLDESRFAREISGRIFIFSSMGSFSTPAVPGVVPAPVPAFVVLRARSFAVFRASKCQEQNMKISELSPEQQQIKREYNRLQKRKSREKETLKQLSKMGAAIEAERARQMNEQGFRDRLARNICFFGEVSPGVDAQTITDALQVCREFARALNQPDVQQPEHLRDFELRIGRVWLEHGGPFLNRRNQELRKGWGDYWREKNFTKVFKFLPNAAKPVEVSALPPLPPLPETKTAVVVPAPSPVVPLADDARLEKGFLEQKRRMNSYVGLTPDAVQYLRGE